MTGQDETKDAFRLVEWEFLAAIVSNFAGSLYRSKELLIKTRIMRRTVFPEFERTILRERTKVGLYAARQDGRTGGRRPKLSSEQ